MTQKVFSKNFLLGEIRKKFKHFQSDFIVDIFNHEHIKDHPSVAKIVHIKIIDFAGKLRCFFSRGKERKRKSFYFTLELSEDIPSSAKEKRNPLKFVSINLWR